MRSFSETVALSYGVLRVSALTAGIPDEELKVPEGCSFRGIIRSLRLEWGRSVEIVSALSMGKCGLFVLKN